jgi:uncharacterized protein with FMN-binding domain
MKRKKWRGTALFVGILVVMGLTIGLRLYSGGAFFEIKPEATTAEPHPGTPSVELPAAPTPSAAAVLPSGPQDSSSTASAPAAAAASAATTDQTIDGQTEQTPFGSIQVAVTFAGSEITAVKELQSPSDERRSEEINTLASPVLAKEVLLSQSANVDTVSGATYTSMGYEQSVQSAIDKR